MDVHLDTDWLRTFVAIVDEGSFTQAAKRVHRTQSAVSMQVKRLEESLGRPLFQREGRAVAITPDGEALLGYARRILKLHAEAVATFREPELSGAVRIGTPDDYVLRFLPGILTDFARSCPQVQVAVRCEPSGVLTEALARGELDLALITCAPGAETGEVVRREPTVWATSERHSVHEDDPLPLALFQEGCMFRGWAFRALDGLGRRYRVAYVSPSVAGIQAAVLAGLAVTVLGQSSLPPGIRPLRPEEGFPALPMSTITLRRAPAPRARAIERLAEAIHEGFRAPQTEGDNLPAEYLLSRT